MTELILDAAGRRRSPATMPGFHAGRPPRNKGHRYRADPPTVEEIVAVMRAAGNGLHGQPARVNHADMAGLAALGSRDGLDTVRPAPSRLEREPSRGRTAHAHDVHAGLVGRPRLVSRIEVPRFHTGHGRLLSSIDRTILAPAGPALQASPHAGRAAGLAPSQATTGSDLALDLELARVHRGSAARRL
jgi:hypothetical protein